jgi:CRP-like cAMP-binding protein
MYHEWLEVLGSSPLFRGIGPEALNTMLVCLKPRVHRCKQREVIAVYGQPFHGVGVVASGSLALTRETSSGNRIMLGIITPGQIFGETAAFSDTRVWPATVIAQEDSVVLFLPADRIVSSCSNVCRSHNTLIMNTLGIVSNRALFMSQQIEHLSARNNRAKLSGYLLEIYRQQRKVDLTLPMKRHELADYLNMPRPSLSRELCLMRDGGLIQFHGSSVKLMDIHRLEESIA